MMIGFIRCDLICVMKAYLNSKSGLERSLQLRKIYLTEVSALTHLYGYNQVKKTKSLWQKLIDIDTNHHEIESATIQEDFKELTLHLDSTRRNLYIHFREDKDLNILKRYETYKRLDQIVEINKSLKLIHLCKKIENYTKLILKKIEKKEHLKYQKQEDHFHKTFEDMRQLINNIKSSEDMKLQSVNMIDEMEEKINNIFKIKN